MVIYRLGLPYYKEFDNFQFIKNSACPCRKFYGRAGAFFLYCVLSGGKGKLTPIGQGDIGGQIGRDLKLIDCHIAVIPPAAYNAPGWGIVGGFCPVQRFVGVGAIVSAPSVYRMPHTPPNSQPQMAP